MKCFCLQDTFADGTVACLDKFFPVHKLILSSCSDYFNQVFEMTGDKNSIVILKDVSPDIFEALLSYMYDGKVDITKDKIPDLIKAATALKIKGLAVAPESSSEESSINQNNEADLPTADGTVKDSDTKKRPIDEVSPEEVLTVKSAKIDESTETKKEELNAKIDTSAPTKEEVKPSDNKNEAFFSEVFRLAKIFCILST